MITPLHIQNIDISKIQISLKDIERVQNLKWQKRTFFGNGAPYKGEAEKMAKTIKCPQKLVARTKAVVQEYGRQTYIGLSNGGKNEHPCNPYEIFKQAMLNMGFSYFQISQL